MLVALIALCVALGGTGYAASSLRVAAGPGAGSAAKHHSSDGDSSERGPRGRRGKTGRRGRKGRAGLQGAQGAKGDTGQTGPIGPSQFAEFFALMPTDNPATVAVGSAVEFPQNGPNNGAIVRSGPSTFVLSDVGTYRVAFSVPVSEPGQLELTLNSTPLAYTVYGRATGTTSISGEALVTTTASNSVVSVINPSGNSSALTITPSAGDAAHPAAASLVIERLS